MNDSITLEEVKQKIEGMSYEELKNLSQELYDEYCDFRKSLDEQIVVNEKMCNNYYFYEASVYEALAKLLYVKAEIMMRRKW